MKGCDCGVSTSGGAWQWGAVKVFTQDRTKEGEVYPVHHREVADRAVEERLFAARQG